MSFLNRFYTKTDGNIAVMFGLSLFVLLGAIGIGVDYSGMESKRSELQNQADSAVLAVATSRKTDAKKMKKIARAALKANGFKVSKDSFQVTNVGEGRVQVKLSGAYKTDFMGIFGKTEMPISVVAESLSAVQFPVDIALVLDTTGSMAGTKLSTLQTASRKLVDEVSKVRGAKVKIALVPFAQYVNVGVGNRNKSWINVPANYTKTETYTYTPTLTAPTCVPAGPPQTHVSTSTNDGVTSSSSYTYTPQNCTGGVYGPPETRTRSIPVVWEGCVGSRLSPLHREDDKYSTRIQGFLNDTVTCAKTLIPLTTNMNSLRTAISSLSATGETYMPAGLMWGLRVLSPQEPFNEGGDPRAGVKKVMILMSDGKNTIGKNGLLHTSNDPVETNKDVERMCKIINDEKIIVYTIAFQVKDSATKTRLKNCSTLGKKYYNADNNNRLLKAFESISDELKDARLTL